MTKLRHAFPQLAMRRSPDASPAVKKVRPNGQGIESRKRAQTVLVAFAHFAAVFAAIIASRVVVWPPAFRHYAAAPCQLSNMH